jgi:hypothetical protein
MTSLPLTPPPELVNQWLGAYFGCIFNSELSDSEHYITTQAAQWGADQELEACCLWMERNFDDWDNRFSDELRRHRRPKPPSLKAEALALLEPQGSPARFLNEDQMGIIRRALEVLND